MREYLPNAFYNNEAAIPNSVKGNHLESPFEHRIKIKTYDTNDPYSYIKFLLGTRTARLVEEALLINYSEPAHSKYNLSQKILSKNVHYLISPVDERPKRSAGYINCTAVVAIGEDAITGRNISALSHQNTGYMQDDPFGLEFEHDMLDTIREIISRSNNNTVDITILAGNYYGNNIRGGDVEYYYLIEKIKHAIVKEFGEEWLNKIVLLTGPNHSAGLGLSNFADILVDTESRVVEFVRETQNYDLTEAVVSANDSREYLQALSGKIREQRKSDVISTQAKVYGKMEKQNSPQKIAEQNFMTSEELATFDKVKSLPIQTYTSIVRPDIVYDRTTIRTDSELNKTHEYCVGDYIIKLTERKTTINNMELLAKKLFYGGYVLAENNVAIKSSTYGHGAILYYHNKNDNTFEGVFGGTRGFLNYYENANREESLISNTCVVLKSLQDLIDDIVPPELISIYTRTLHETARNMLTDSLGSSRTRDLLFDE